MLAIGVRTITIMKAMLRRALATVGLAGLVSLTGSCGSSGPSAGTSATPAKISVVTTSTVLTDFAREVGDSSVRVYGILKANVDPHDYEPSPADVDALAKADVIVKNGVGLEKWFDDTIKSASPKGPVVDASQGVQIRAGTGEEEAAGDPH